MRSVIALNYGGTQPTFVVEKESAHVYRYFDSNFAFLLFVWSAHALLLFMATEKPFFVLVTLLSMISFLCQGCCCQPIWYHGTRKTSCRHSTVRRRRRHAVVIRPSTLWDYGHAGHPEFSRHFSFFCRTFSTVLQALLLYFTLVAIACLSFVCLSSVWTFTPRLKVTRHVDSPCYFVLLHWSYTFTSQRFFCRRMEYSW